LFELNSLVGAARVAESPFGHPVHVLRDYIAGFFTACLANQSSRITQQRSLDGSLQHNTDCNYSWHQCIVVFWHKNEGNA